MRKYLGMLARRLRLHDPYRQASYSQDGEDRILARLFENQADGFFVDVGAHHPRRFSNTYLFYRRGWKGINIDPTPNIRAVFQRERPRDVTLEVGVTGERGQLRFHLYDEPAFNTFNEASARMMQERGYPRLIATQTVETLPLREILRAHCPAGQRIDFLTVDAEGFDLPVLQSNDWQAFRPRAVVAEDDVEGLQAGPLTEFLVGQGYQLVAKTFISAIFLDRSQAVSSAQSAAFAHSA